MPTRFLPVREAELDQWLENFSAKISAAPAVYGLTDADAASLAAAVAAWRTAFLAADAPTTRTALTVQAKRAQKKSVTAAVRSLAARIRSNDTIAAALKIELGLVLREARPPRVHPPATEPALSLAEMRPGLHALRAVDAHTAGRGKPARAAGLVVFRAVGEGVAQNPDEGTYLGLFTRTSFASGFTEADRGKLATYFARWVNAKGEPGPWSRGLCVSIAA